MSRLVKLVVLFVSLTWLGAWSGVAMAAATFQAAGAAVGGTGAVSPAWPAHAVGDIALLFVESTGGQAATLSTPATFVEVLNSPKFTGAGTNGTRLTVFWARATSTTMSAPTVADPGNHVYARIVTYRGATSLGDPWDVTGGGVRALANVTVSGVTTTVPNTRIVQAVTRDNDSAAAAFSAQTNANLAGIAERSDAGTTSGNGGGFGVWDGAMAAAGATGDTTATVAITDNAFLTIALKPQPGPRFQAAGAAASGTGAVTPAWPTHAAGDIALLFVESTGGQAATLSTPAGFAAVPDSPQSTGAGTAGTRLTVFWRRATSAAMTAPTVADPGNHVYAQIITYRGVANAGNPWNVTAGGVKAAASTSVSVTGVTTTVADTLVVQAATRDNDNAAAAFSAQANASLTGIGERVDAGTTSGNGGGFAVWDGYKATAGATGNTTATVANSINAFMTIALRPQAISTPAYQAAGAQVSGTGAVTPAWPAHAAGDIALLFVESTGGQAATLSTPAGFAAVPNSPQFTGAAAAGTRLTVFWARATSAAMAAPTVADPGDHVYARIITYRGAINTGNPWDVTGGGVRSVANVTVSGVTTTVPDTRIVQAVTRDNDSAAAAFSAQTNANLTGIAERSDAGTTSGNGGGFGVWDGVMAAAGATGDTTAAVTNSSNAFLTIALKSSAILHHVRIEHAGAGVTCTGASVSVVACNSADAGSPASCTANTSGLTGNVVAKDAGGTIIATVPFTIVGGSSSTTVSVPVTTPQTVTFETSGLSVMPSASPVWTCWNTVSNTASCSMAYADSGFIFNVPDHRAEVSQSVTVSAVKKADDSLSCTPAFASVSKTVNFKCAYSNPAAGTLPVRVGGANVACDATGGNVALAFNASGVATISVIYADVGSMGLSASYTGSGADAGLVMTGTDSFIAAPSSFSVATTGPYVAGAAFSGTVTARNAAGNATPNFGKEAVAESVAFSLGSRIQPAGANDCANGPCDGTVAGSVTLPWAGGAASASDLTYSEVGQMTLAATLASGSYLGSGLNAAGTSATIGDFVPAYFDTAVTQGCVAGGFTYSAQPFTVDVTARNAAGNVTVNYSNLAGCTVCSRTVTLYDPTATANFNGTNTIADTAFAKGIGSRNTVAYTLPTPTTAPAAITLRAIDASVTPNVSSAGHTEGTAAVRSGRLRLFNANGSELLPLPIPLRLEYWSGAATGWTAHAADSCTAIQASDFAFVFPLAAGNNLAACETAATVGGASPNYTVSLASPGAGNAGWTDLTLNLGAAAAGSTCTAVGGAGPAATTANAPWLQFNWKGAGAANPTARATFGVYRSGPVIHRREMY